MLFLDFDGVICDSLEECLASSWIAYYVEYLGIMPQSCPVELKDKFLHLRPYIRLGEEYLAVQEMIKENVNIGDVKSQADFDRIMKDFPPEKLRLYGDLLYRVREELIKKCRDLFFLMNPLFRTAAEVLLKYGGSGKLRILSTKRSEIVIEILKYNRIDMNPETVVYSGKRKKLEIIEEFMDALGLEKAVFIDDQIDHLKDNKNERITVLLAGWGYVCREWEVLYPKIRAIREKEMADWAEKFCS